MSQSAALLLGEAGGLDDSDLHDPARIQGELDKLEFEGPLGN